MKYWAVLMVITSFVSGGSVADEHVASDSIAQANDQEGCVSIVCKNVIEPQSVSAAGEFPPRKGNEILTTLGSVLFVAGEVGLADNLQQEPTDQSPVD
ncbi:hypothetical protein RJD38_19080 [Vibrio scophthalmi]|uniref:Uncharacterized protein n=2 Tax=Vibrio scophthalmi TaxID=45658 RepID=F9RIQ4_9VIBR|nr:hypothetical protein [Vibrio scophthalmi]ANU38313.1 hypothetical protein VSVS05_03275 [Vibrio scophthalmi]EGU41816.1 hypothetical protein VIS19158_10424 [Vibrio scophthalmi LMG 19158]